MMENRSVRLSLPGLSTIRPALLPALGLLLLTAIFTWPLLRAPGTIIAVDEGDPLFNAYVLNWGAYALFYEPGNVFDAPFYYPSLNTLSLSDHLLSVSWPFSPLVFLGNPVLFYNVLFVGSFFLSAFLFFRYLSVLGLGPMAAWCGAALFGFLPWKYGQLSHIQLLFTWWIPFTLLQFESWRKRPSFLRASATGLGFALVFLSSVYHGLFFFLFFPLYAAVRTLSARRDPSRVPGRLRVSHAAAGAAVAFIVMAPSLLAYARVPTVIRHLNSIAMITPRGADLTDYVNPPAGSRLWSAFGKSTHPYSDVPWEMHAFPGGLPLAAFAVALPLVAWRRRELRAALPAWTAVPALLAASAACFIVSLGPVLHSGGVTIGRSLPYEWLFHFFSPLRAVRVPARAAFYVGLAGAAIAAILIELAGRSLRTPKRQVFFAFFIVLVLIDVWPRPMPFVRPTEYLRLRHAFQATNSAVGHDGTDLVLPINDAINYAAPLASAGPFRFLVNGKSGYLLPENARIFENLSFATPGPALVDTLYSLSVTRLFVDRQRLGPDAASRIVALLDARSVTVRSLGTFSDYDALVIQWP